MGCYGPGRNFDLKFFYDNGGSAEKTVTDVPLKFSIGYQLSTVLHLFKKYFRDGYHVSGPSPKTIFPSRGGKKEKVNLETKSELQLSVNLLCSVHKTIAP